VPNRGDLEATGADVERDLDLVEVEKLLRHGMLALVEGLLRDEDEHPEAASLVGGLRVEPAALCRRADLRLEGRVEREIELHVEPEPHRLRLRGHDRCAVTARVRDAPDHAGRPGRRSMLIRKERGGRKPERRERLAGTESAAAELGAPFRDRLRDRGELLREERVVDELGDRLGGLDAAIEELREWERWTIGSPAHPLQISTFLSALPLPLSRLQLVSPRPACSRPGGCSTVRRVQKLEEGIHHFQANYFASNRELFEQLSEAGQRPETLFITCCDSRLVPNLITASAPGELFIVRNIGNIVPSVERGVLGGVSAAIEYAVEVLEVGNVIVCGHTNCGAIDAILNPERLKHLPYVSRWLEGSASIPKLIEERYGHLEGEARMTAAVEENVLVQLENLRSFKFVARRLDSGKLKMSGWVFKIATGDVFDYDPHSGQFLQLGLTDGPRASLSSHPPPPSASSPANRTTKR
jgi:carbonic anhydrase